MEVLMLLKFAILLLVLFLTAVPLLFAQDEGWGPDYSNEFAEQYLEDPAFSSDIYNSNSFLALTRKSTDSDEQKSKLHFCPEIELRSTTKSLKLPVNYTTKDVMIGVTVPYITKKTIDNVASQMLTLVWILIYPPLCCPRRWGNISRT